MNISLRIPLATNTTPCIDAERALIDRCLAGEARAERTLYERFYRLVLGTTSRYALDQQQAMDFANRTFLTVFNNLSKYRGEGSLAAWVKSVCVNECLSQLRIRRNQPYQEIPDHHEVSADPAALAALQLEDLVALIQSLPPVPRTVFNLTAVEGFSHAEVARRLGIKENNSRYHLRQARLQLRAALTELKYTR